MRKHDDVATGCVRVIEGPHGVLITNRPRALHEKPVDLTQLARDDRQNKRLADALVNHAERLGGRLNGV